ncbi:UNVERIFIED_CONTAM: hypothetical protein HDU68_010559 [Siphonaria sp. JEL0065]|nr:hypothetical protein HDU68_010559 [Siphonaria sp. JEL0065]
MPYNKTTTQTTKTVTAADCTKTTTTTPNTKSVYELIVVLAAGRLGPYEDFYKYANHAWLNDPNVVIPADSVEKRSTALVNEWVGFLLGQVYVKRYFDQSDKDRVSGMIQEVVKLTLLLTKLNAAIIQPPFYAKSVDAITFAVEPKDRAILNNEGLVLDAVNFGGIAAGIAHEITHGFDDQGRSFDGEGNVRDWWTEDDSNLFKTKCDCWKSKDGHFLAVQVLLKCAEGVAGLSGKAKLALMRIFFFSRANVWRTKATDSYLVNRFATDPHSPGNVRCNLVKNIDYFYEAFDVKEGDPNVCPKS